MTAFARQTPLRRWRDKRERRRCDAIIGALYMGVHGVLEIQRQIGYNASALYISLSRLQAMNIVEARWELPVPADRPRRRFYYLAGNEGLAGVNRRRAGK